MKTIEQTIEEFTKKFPELFCSDDKHKSYTNCEEEVKNFIRQSLLSHTKNIADDILKIIDESKATFFINKDEKDMEIPCKEIIYELRATISNAVSLYFYEKTNKEN